jgi:hypothetical protein
MPCGDASKTLSWKTVTARAFIDGIKKMPQRERRKVFAWVNRELTKREDQLDRRAAAKAKAEIAAGAKPRALAEVCREMER